MIPGGGHGDGSFESQFLGAMGTFLLASKFSLYDVVMSSEQTPLHTIILETEKTADSFLYPIIAVSGKVSYVLWTAILPVF